MADPALVSAAHLALLAGVIAIVSVVVAAVFLVRVAWQVWTTVRAAQALTSTHLDVLDARVGNTLANLGPISEQSADLAESLESLQQTVKGLRTLVMSVPRERARFNRRLLDVVLPTDDPREARATATAESANASNEW